MSSLERWHCVATGRVQGVNYRARVAESARRWGIVGSVENRSDGTVFIDAQGPVDALESFLGDILGPRGISHARSVERVASVPVDAGRVAFEIVR